MKYFCFLVIGIIVQTKSVAQEKKWALDTNKSEISYTGNHVLHAWKGVNRKVKGILVIEDKSPEIKELALLTLVRDFDSKNSGRDAHAMEVLEALSYPEVRFYSNNFEKIKDSILIHGQMDFHGVVKNHTITAYKEERNNQLLLKGNFNIQPTRYGIDLPSFMLVKMDDLLIFDFELVFNK